MKKNVLHAPETPGTRFLKQHHVNYTPFVYDYEAHGGTHDSSQKLGVLENAVIKTLVMEDENREPLIMLMHGDHKVSTKELARQARRKHIESCKPEVAQRHTGYFVGGTSPFGLRKSLPVFMEKTILNLPVIYINGGKRGFLVCIHPNDIIRTLSPQLVSAALHG